ncbi:MAG TPA: twin-arginine translocase subunit TatC [Bacteroidales bacterium]|nr:twin-arginine translocase subunit TatC [Bacteroidales bacterium]
MAEDNANAKKHPPREREEREMSFWEHLDELRWHLVRSIVAVLVLAIVAFIFKDFIFNRVILAPIRQDFFTTKLLCEFADLVNVSALCLDNSKLEIINIKMSGQFLTHMYISIMSGVILAFPYILHEIWSFIEPALKPMERKYSGGAVVVCSVLFLTGVLFSYFLIVPLTINFLGTYQVSEAVANNVSLSSYISTVVSVSLSVGIVFELPVFVFFLAKVGIITPDFLKRNRKYTIVILLIISAIITPPDIFSQIMVVIPLMGLYELSIVIARRVSRKQKQKELAG